MIVEDHSMEPELLPGDRLWYDPRAYRQRGPRAGDLVVLADPDGSGRWLIKVVAAVGGTTVYVVRDGVRTSPTDPGPMGPVPSDAIDAVAVGDGEVFVTSRRATGTRDSRTFGPVRVDRLLGRAWFRYAPADRRGPIGPTPGSRPS